MALERNSYLAHLDKIRRAHEIELKNVRMTLIDIADEVVTKKINAFQKVIEAEFERFLWQTLHVQSKVLKTLNLFKLKSKKKWIKRKIKYKILIITITFLKHQLK